ncbi:hypothetical protein [Hymenobacter sp. BRD67]|uniref:hypothetical protein n=1 Tax=Hymenobacter sp. BRD67 TaxID=2675877 RepID=UPI001567AEC2|nr:hypothetical protein [Hymenobacter sp. BRD67]QKG52820.1 hypothetical protein GKZ67_09675 [Hymenobacter sp. BRD67]
MSDDYKIKWLKKPKKHDYKAATTYLSLLYKADLAKQMVKELEETSSSDFQAKDIFRASALPMLDTGNRYVEQEYNKITRGEKLAPLLLVRDSANTKVTIADGYHRLCAVYAVNEDAAIRCKIV